MKVVKIRKSAETKAHLNAANVSFTETAGYLHITPNAEHQAYLASGQMSVASYKKNILGL